MILNNELFSLFCSRFLEITDWGSTDTESLKKGIGSIFLKDCKSPAINYETKLVSLPLTVQV